MAPREFRNSSLRRIPHRNKLAVVNILNSCSFLRSSRRSCVLADLSSIYISGWQCSSTASSTNEPGPDFADYPMDTVPKKCESTIPRPGVHDNDPFY
jgi:isocitrate lyase